MQCKKCDAPVEFAAFRGESVKRFRQFVVLALVLLLVGIGLQLAGVSLWPVWLYVTSAFVFSQALLKWQDGRWVICRNCGHGCTHY